MLQTQAGGSQGPQWGMAEGHKGGQASRGRWGEEKKDRRGRLSCGHQQCAVSGRGPPIRCRGARCGALPQQLRPWRFSVSNQPSRALVCAPVPTRQARSGLPG